MRKVLIIRHGATVLNHADSTRDLLRGWMDLPLSDEGRNEAQALGEQLNYPDGPHFDYLMCSDLQRAIETAEIIADYLITSFEAMMDFRPWNIGELAGKPAIHAADILGQFADLTPLKPVPGGESFQAFRSRFYNGLLRVLTEHGGTIAIVTHHRCERLLAGWANYGFRIDGSVDQDVFTKKGEPTGKIREFEIPFERLRAAAEWPKVLA